MDISKIIVKKMLKVLNTKLKIGLPLSSLVKLIKTINIIKDTNKPNIIPLKPKIKDMLTKIFIRFELFIPKAFKIPISLYFSIILVLIGLKIEIAIEKSINN